MGVWVLIFIRVEEMDGLLISQLSQTLEDFRTYFLNQSQSLNREIRASSEKFTEKDRAEFDQILREIREFALSKITNFINTRIEVKSKTFIEYFEEYEENTENLKKDLESFRGDIQDQARRLQREEQQGEEMLIKIVDKYSRDEMMRKGFRAFKFNTDDSLKSKIMEGKARQMYETKLKQRSFFPWRALTYKDGYQNSMKRQNLAQIRRVHSQFGSILTVLKQKIMQVEDLIRTKRAAKNEFAYALSKNLLKTISNLSLEVMSLNQITTTNKTSENDTQEFLNEIHATVKTRVENTMLFQKIEQVNNPETRIRSPDGEGKKTGNRMTSPKQKDKRISFA